MNTIYLFNENLHCNEILDINLKLNLKDSYKYHGLNINENEFKVKIIKAMKSAYNKKYNISAWNSLFQSLEKFVFGLLKNNPLIVVVYNDYIIYGDLFNNITSYNESFLSINDKLQIIKDEIKRVESERGNYYNVLTFAYDNDWIIKQNKAYEDEVKFQKMVNLYK